MNKSTYQRTNRVFIERIEFRMGESYFNLCYFFLLQNLSHISCSFCKSRQNNGHEFAEKIRLHSGDIHRLFSDTYTGGTTDRDSGKDGR